MLLSSQKFWFQILNLLYTRTLIFDSNLYFLLKLFMNENYSRGRIQIHPTSN